MSIPGAAGLREATWVQSGWRALSACWVHCCVCITGGQQHSSIQLNSLHTHVTPLLQQWAVAWVEQMCHWNQECLPWARTAQSPGHTCQGWGMATCSNTSPVATGYTRCPVYPAHKNLLSSPRSTCSVYFQVCCSLLDSPPLPFNLEKERQKGNVSCILYYATMAAACDCLLGWLFSGNGQDVGMIRKGMWASLQLLDTILLLQGNLQDWSTPFAWTSQIPNTNFCTLWMKIPPSCFTASAPNLWGKVQ